MGTPASQLELVPGNDDPDEQLANMAPIDRLKVYGDAYTKAMAAGDQEAMDELHGNIKHTIKQHEAFEHEQNDPLKDAGVGTQLTYGSKHALGALGDTLATLGKGYGNAMAESTIGSKAYPGPPDSSSLDREKIFTTKNQDEYTDEHPWAAAGDIGTSVLATSPIGVAGGSLLKTLAAKGLLDKAVPRYLAKTGVAAGEGAAENTLTGDDPLSGAVGSAGFSTALGAAGRVGKGLVGKSDAANRLIENTDQYLPNEPSLRLPMSQAGTGPMKTVYQSVLPYAIGVEKKLDSQAGKASAKAERAAAQQAMPIQEDEKGNIARVPVNYGSTTQETAANMREQMDRLYTNTVKKHTFDVPQNFAGQITDNLNQATSGAGITPQTSLNVPPKDSELIGNTMDSVLRSQSADGETLTGGAVLNARNKARVALSKLVDAHGVPIVNDKVKEKAMDSFNDFIQSELQKQYGAAKESGDLIGAEATARDLRNFERLGPAYSSLNAYASTSENNPQNRGQINWGQLAKNAAPGSEQQQYAQDAHQILENESPGSVTPAGRHALHQGENLLAGGSALGFMTGHPMGAAIIGGSNLIATEPVQRALYGDTRAQQALADFMRSKPRLAHQMDYYTRAALNRKAADAP